MKNSKADNTVPDHNSIAVSAGAPSRFPTRRSLLVWFLQGALLWILAGVLFHALATLFDLLGPRIVGYTVDHLLVHTETGGRPNLLLALLARILSAAKSGGLPAQLWLVAALVLAAAACGALFRYLGNLLNSVGAEKLVETMRNRLFEQLEHL